MLALSSGLRAAAERGQGWETGGVRRAGHTLAGATSFALAAGGFPAGRLLTSRHVSLGMARVVVARRRTLTAPQMGKGARRPLS